MYHALAFAIASAGTCVRSARLSSSCSAAPALNAATRAQPRLCSTFVQSRARCVAAPHGRFRHGPHSPRMMGPLPMPEPGAFPNPIINEDILRMHKDQDQLMKLGVRYRTFDRAGKLAYIDAVEDLHDRWFILLTRLQLCEDFTSQMFVQQLRSRLSEVGSTVEKMREQLRKDMDAMRRAAETLP